MLIYFYYITIDWGFSIVSSLIGEVLYNRIMANHNSFTRSFYLNGDMLRSVLKLKHITQQELAKKINVGKNTINRAVNLNRMESKNDFDHMCQFLDISPYLLLEKNPIIGDDQFHDKITPDNVSDFLDHFGYDGYERQLSSDVYIHQFLKNNSDCSDYLGKFPNIEKFIFDKVIEKRDEYIELFGEYFINELTKAAEHGDNSVADINSDSFKRFFYQHIKNK